MLWTARRSTARGTSALGAELLSGYRQRLGEGFEARCQLLAAALDLGADGRVTWGEFQRQAPLVLLPREELRMEAQFYKGRLELSGGMAIGAAFRCFQGVSGMVWAADRVFR